jgi:hypothetical protein
MQRSQISRAPRPEQKQNRNRNKNRTKKIPNSIYICTHQKREDQKKLGSHIYLFVDITNETKAGTKQNREDPRFYIFAHIKRREDQKKLGSHVYICRYYI